MYVMPTYDYKCTECSEVFEKFHGISESPEVSCPKCSSTAEKQISAGAGIHYKGSGFYTTDYKNNSAPAPAPAPAPACAGGNCPNKN